MHTVRFAYDRRTRDENGHMHVAKSIITRGIISEYLASEMPGAIERGYAPDQLIRIYRDPAELAKGLDSFKDIPLLRRHVMVSAVDPQKDDIAGVVSNPVMDGIDMRADVTLWTAEDGIDLVTSGEQEELSCGYTFDLDWTEGDAEGLRYVARMFNIKGNHCALVHRGRVPGARVADQQPESVMSSKSKFPLFASIVALLGLKPEQVTALDAAIEADAKDAFPEPKDKKKSKKKMGAEAESEEEEESEAEDSEDLEAADKAAKDAADKTAKEAKDAEIKTAVDAAIKATHDLYAARDAVADKVGVTALDSAEATYRFALDKAGVAHAGVAADALPVLWTASNTKSDSAPAQDSAALDMISIFPGLSLIRKG